MVLTSKAQVVAIALYMAASISLFDARSASAQSVMADVWTADDTDDNGVLALYGYGDADSGGSSGRIGVSVVIYDPSWQQLAVQGGHSFSGYVSAQTSIGIGPYATDGDYHVEAAGDYDFQHFDCGWQTAGVSHHDWFYRLENVDSNGGWYRRCNYGDCDLIRMPADKLPGHQYVPYAQARVLFVNLGFATLCHWQQAISVPQCYPDV